MSGQLHACLLHLVHAVSHGVLRQLRLAQGLGVAALNLVTDGIQRRSVAVSGHLVHGVERLGDLLLHLRLLELGKQLGTLVDLFTQGHAIALDGLLGLLCLLKGLIVELLGVFHRLLCGNQLRGEGLCGVLVLGGLGVITCSASLISKLQRLAGIALQLLNLIQAAVELHLQLTLVTDDSSCLLRKLLVLALCVLDGLLDLYLGISVFFDLGIEECHQVLPCLGKWIRH